MSVTITPPAQAATDRKLVSVTWPLVVITALMLLLSLASNSILSSLRAYVNGEGLWSKAERQAAAELRKYSTSGQEQGYERFEAELAVPMGDRVARLQLQSAHPDVRAVQSGFMAGRNDPRDIPGMIRLFRLFRTNPLLAEPVRIWTEGDALVLQLAHIGDQLHTQMQHQPVDPQRIAALLAEAEQIHRRLAPLEDGFSAALGSSSREVARLLFVFLSVCSAVLVAIGIAISRRNLGQQQVLATRLEYQATHDSLTGLRNRHDFELQLAHAIEEQRRSSSTYAVLYLDLDQFKVINDTCGHAAGDDLIRQVAWLIRNQLDSSAIFARLGGDEFGILLSCKLPADALTLAETIRKRIADLRFHWDTKVFIVTASIGVLMLDEALPSVGGALSAVDQACYLAKDSGRNRVQYYRRDDHEVRSRHGEMNWVERISAALDANHFVLLAQKIKHIGSCTTATESSGDHFELLLRMVAPDGQWVAPMAFIPAAERYGLMPRIDRWVIAQACRELAALGKTGATVPTCMINLSGASVSDTSLADYISTRLSDHNLSGRHVGFELTETAAIGNLASASQLFARLRALGCPISLDDFGSGMSSFSYLKALPIDYLKIDGTFVRDVSTDRVDFAVVEAIQRVARAMGIRTVAECVEEAAALDALMSIGVDFAQGFYVHKPVRLTQIDTSERVGYGAFEALDAPTRMTTP